MLDGFSVLFDVPVLSLRAEKFMRALIGAAPSDAVVIDGYDPSRRVLVMYGPGAPTKLPLIAQHRHAGGRVAMWDMGYWNREAGMRLSVDALHPTAEHLQLAPPGAGRRSFELREDSRPDGPILLIGLGPKSEFAYGINGPQGWERKKLKQLAKRFPGRRICYRPKGSPTPLNGAETRYGMPIEEALAGCSLVVCRHSNVAVDACVAGIPVECEDGAALALYGRGTTPSHAERAEFLRQLTWWEWSRDEARAAWDWIRKVTE